MLCFAQVRMIPPAERAYSADVRGGIGIVATADKHMVVYNLQGQPMELRRVQSYVNAQTRCVKLFPDPVIKKENVTKTK